MVACVKSTGPDRRRRPRRQPHADAPGQPPDGLPRTDTRHKARAPDRRSLLGSSSVMYASPLVQADNPGMIVAQGDAKLASFV